MNPQRSLWKSETLPLSYPRPEQLPVFGRSFGLTIGRKPDKGARECSIQASGNTPIGNSCKKKTEEGIEEREEWTGRNACPTLREGNGKTQVQTANLGHRPCCVSFVSIGKPPAHQSLVLNTT